MRFARLVFSGVAGMLLLGPAAPRAIVDGQAAASSQAAGQAAASDQQPLTFKSTTSIVEVDVVVHNSKGDFVPSLAAEDLRIFEDGKEQKIQQFYLVTHERGGQPFTLNDDQRGILLDPTTEDRARRIFVMLFDEGHLAHDSLMRARAGAEAFIKQNIGPGDFGGVFYAGGMYHGRLTNSRAELLTGLSNVKVGFENRQSLLSTFREFPVIPGEIDAMRIASGAKEVADRLGADACEADQFSCQLAGGQNQVENLLEQKARLYVRQARILTSNTLQNLRYVVNRLARIPGRKTVVFISEGFYVEEARSDLQIIAAEAARGGTTIYSIDGRGLSGSPAAMPDVVMASHARGTAFDTGEDGPYILTATTGGLRVHNVDDISRAFNMIVRDTSTYYVIGYQPENAVMDGTFRKIEVKSNVDGLKIRSRSGYAALKLPPMETVRGGWQ